MTPVIAPDGTVYLIEKESEIVAVVPDGTVYIEDILHHTIRQITTDGNVFTLASNEGQGAAPGVPQPPVRGGTDAGIGAPQLNAPRVQGAAPGGPQDGRNLRPGFPGGFPGFGMGGMFPSRVTLAELVDLLEQKLLAMKR